MITNLGISLYPEKTNIKEIEKYLILAKKYNFNSVFINFIDILEQENKEILELYKETIRLCKNHSFIVTIDVNKSTFDYLNIDYKNPTLDFFNDLNVDILRLDDQFNGLFEAILTFNPFNIKIELNPSTFNNHIANVLSYGANVQNLQALHNFYPQRYTGLDYDLFIKHNNAIKSKGIKTGAFITINEHESVGPWDVSENLPTLEIHRDLEIGLQLNHLISNNFVEYIYISTQFATETDFKKIQKANIFKKILKIDLEKNVTLEELEIINYNNHYIRGDLSQKLLRSTSTRQVYKALTIKNRQYENSIIPRGAIVIPNDSYNKYKGELQIVKEDIKNDGLRNVVGFVKKECDFLIDEFTPWVHFKIEY